MKIKNVRAKTIAALFFVIGLLVFSYFAIAGNLQPSGPPAPTMNTLSSVYSLTDSVNNSVSSLQGSVSTLNNEVSQIGDPAKRAGPETAADNRWVIAMQCSQPPCQGEWEPGGGHGEYSKVLDLDWSLTQPFDQATGNSTDPRLHDVVTVTKNIDRATPGLTWFLTTGQVISQVDLLFLRPEGDPATLTMYYKIRLENAKVVKVAQRMEHRGEDEFAHLEEVSFVYWRIHWIWTNGGIEYQDDWWLAGGD